MRDVRYRGKSPEQRIADRLKPSGEGLGADHHVVKGTGPTRTHTFVHHSAGNQGLIRRNANGDQHE
jgi:hypothetical protein